MAWPDDLIRYQEIDHALEAINKRLAAIQATLADQSALTEAHHALAQRESEVKAARQAQKTLEFDLGAVEAKLRNTQHKLYSGKVTNPRELQDLQAEAQSLKRRQATLEDALLEAMLTREAADEALTAAQTHADAVQATLAAQTETLEAERAQLRTQGRALLHEGQQLQGVIPASVIESYNYLKSRTGGVPVARLVGDTCSMCGVGVMKPTERKVHNGEEAYCGGCHRLIVA